MIKEIFNKIEEKIISQGLEMDNFYESASNEELAVDFILNNKQEYQGNADKFINLFDDNFRSKYTQNKNEVKDIILDLMTDIF